MELITVNELIKKDITGKIICFPTDTVYGVGCLYNDITAIHKIYELKNRDYSKPLAILTPFRNNEQYVKNINPSAQQLMKQYWPGALTIIFEKKDTIPMLATSNMNTVGLRMPNSQVALKILNHFGLMTTTSVNISGCPAINNLQEIIDLFGDQIDYIVTDLEETSNVSSTVISCINDDIKVLRQGDIKINCI